MHTIRIIYASEGRPGLRQPDLVDIMAQAAGANRKLAITGMLCYGSGQFLQALEGERHVVNTLYHYIVTDPRHTDCQLLSVEDISERLFGEWSMKVVNWTDIATARAMDMLVKHSGAGDFDPARMNGRQATAFLADIAEMERRLAD